MAVRRPMYRRKDAFTVLRHIRLTSKTALQVGDKIESCGYAAFRLLNWYRKGMIAQHGSKYVEQYLEAFKNKHGKRYAYRVDKSIIKPFYTVETDAKQPMIPSYVQPVLAVKEVAKDQPASVIKEAVEDQGELEVKVAPKAPVKKLTRNNTKKSRTAKKGKK